MQFFRHLSESRWPKHGQIAVLVEISDMDNSK